MLGNELNDGLMVILPSRFLRWGCAGTEHVEMKRNTLMKGRTALDSGIGVDGSQTGEIP